MVVRGVWERMNGEGKDDWLSFLLSPSHFFSVGGRTLNFEWVREKLWAQCEMMSAHPKRESLS